MAKQYTVRVREQDADYNQDAGWNVTVSKAGFPPHNTEFFKTKKAAQAQARKLRKSLP